MFRGCSSLLDINGLKNWNFSNKNDFSYMFFQCSSLKDINGLINWDVSNQNNFLYMFGRCSSLSNLNGLKIGIFQIRIIFLICSFTVHH